MRIRKIKPSKIVVHMFDSVQIELEGDAEILAATIKKQENESNGSFIELENKGKPIYMNAKNILYFK